MTYTIARQKLAPVLASALLLVPTLAPAQTFQRSDPAQLGLSSQKLERLSRVLDQYAADRRLAGGVALVARHGRIAYLHPFGMRDVEAKSPMQADAIFRIASQTKALVSVGIMMLMEDGQLLLGDPVGKYIPQYMKTKVA
ncbi:MAG TPA: serine hydrolase domain-containing protein, partial [Longimicrobiales bacterium]